MTSQLILQEETQCLVHIEMLETVKLQKNQLAQLQKNCVRTQCFVQPLKYIYYGIFMTKSCALVKSVSQVPKKM